MQTTSRIADSIRKYFHAYEAKNRAVIESLLTDDFVFSGPHDNQIDRETYFDRRWPTSQQWDAVHIKDLVENGDEAYVLYEVEPVHGDNFRNTERIQFEGEKIKSVEVYHGMRPVKQHGQDEENE